MTVRVFNGSKMMEHSIKVWSIGLYEARIILLISQITKILSTRICIFPDMYLFAQFLIPSTNKLFKTCLYLQLVSPLIYLSHCNFETMLLILHFPVCMLVLTSNPAISLYFLITMLSFIGFTSEKEEREAFLLPPHSNLVHKVTIWQDLQGLL